MPEIKDTVFAKTSPQRSYSMTEYERFGLVFTKTRVYKFGHWLEQRGLTPLGCGVARRLAVRNPSEGPLPSGSNEEKKSGALLVAYINFVGLLDLCKTNMKRGSMPPNL